MHEMLYEFIYCYDNSVVFMVLLNSKLHNYCGLAHLIIVMLNKKKSRLCLCFYKVKDLYYLLNWIFQLAIENNPTVIYKLLHWALLTIQMAYIIHSEY